MTAKDTVTPEPRDVKLFSKEAGTKSQLKVMDKCLTLLAKRTWFKPPNPVVEIA